MKHIYIPCALSVLMLFSACQSNTDNNKDSDMQLVWSDEFDYQGPPDVEKWDYDMGDGCPTLCGWGNNEKQYYTRDAKNVRVEQGKLIIEARQDREDSVLNYSSARLVSKGKGDWQYGRVEVSAKIPAGLGTWSAIWMLPTEWAYGDWPKSGEIDIMEHVGYDPHNIHGTVHTEAFNGAKGNQKGDSLIIATADDDFHTYAINWTPEAIDFMIDGKVYNTYVNLKNGPDAWPFDQPFYLILNIAVGGNWGGKKGIDESVFPQTMEVAYVRVYQSNP